MSRRLAGPAALLFASGLMAAGPRPSAAAPPLPGLPPAWSGPLCPLQELRQGARSEGRATSGEPTAGRRWVGHRLSGRALRRFWRLHGFDLDRLERARPAQVRQVDNGAQCLAEIQRLGISFRPGPRVRGIAWPVLLGDRVGGLRIHSIYGRPRLMDCRMALALYQVAPLILAAGFDTIHFWGFYSYRNVAHTHHLSRHAFGLAVDVPAFSGPAGRVVVAKDWAHAQGGPKDCIGPVRSVAAARLRGLICRIEAALIFRRILTPDTDYAHRDHIHFSAPRYGEHWVRRSWAGRRMGRSWKRRRSRRRYRRWRHGPRRSRRRHVGRRGLRRRRLHGKSPRRRTAVGRRRSSRRSRGKRPSRKTERRSHRRAGSRPRAR